MYQSGLSDEEWKLICHHFEPKDRRGSGHKHPRKLMVDAILYVGKGGIPWRLMPNDFPPGKRCTIIFGHGINAVYGKWRWTH